METAKDILEKHTGFKPEDNWHFEAQVLAIAKEIADKAWEAGQGHLLQRLDKLETGKTVTAPDKSTFMKELFPESKTPSSET